MSQNIELSGDVSEVGEESDKAEATTLLQLLSRDIAPGAQGRTFQPPQDVLPNVCELVRKLYLQAEKDTSLFTLRGDDPRIQNLNLEHDLALIHQTFVNMLKGETLLEASRQFFYCWYYKRQLIQTIGALETMDARVLVSGDNLPDLFFGETKAYVRGSLHQAGIATSVSMKVAQLAFLVGYLSTADNYKALHLPPPAFLQGMECLAGETIREPLRAMLPNSETPAIRPAHPDWFRHDVPLMESPMWTGLHANLQRAMSQQDSIFCERMSFLRCLICDTKSHLRWQQDQVTFAQAKVLGVLGSLIVLFVSHCQMLQYVQVTAIAVAANVTDAAFAAVANVTGDMHFN